MSEQAKGIVPNRVPTPTPSVTIQAQFRPTDRPDPNVYARIILRRAGIVPLVSLLVACMVLIVPNGADAQSSGQSGGRVQATALASARATIINESVRSRVGTGTAATRAEEVVSAGRIERTLACPPAAAQPARTTVQPCVARRLIIRDMP